MEEKYIWSVLRPVNNENADQDVMIDPDQGARGKIEQDGRIDSGAVSRTGRVEALHARDVVGLNGINIADGGIHQCRDLLPVLIRMVEAKDVAEFVHRDPVKIDHAAAQWTTIGVPGESGIKQGVGFFHRGAAEVDNRNSERVLAERIAENCA